MVPLNANTAGFRAAADGHESRKAFFELWGFNSNTDPVFYLRFEIRISGVVDSEGGAAPEPIATDVITRTEVMACLRAPDERQYTADPTDSSAAHSSQTAEDTYTRRRNSAAAGEWGPWEALISGPAGSPGPAGSAGATPVISGGSVTTLPAGSPASASLVSSGANTYYLDLALPVGSDGIPGSNGTDGVSPTVSVTSVTSGAVIVTSDGSGETSATILNGSDGSDGVSPAVSVTQVTSGAVIVTSDGQGETSATILNGTDGVSPTCSVTSVTSGAVIVTSDAQGEHFATILHGHLEGASEVVSALTSGAIVTTREAVPVALKTSAGNLYPLEKGTITISSGAWTIDPAAYLAYDNVSSFSGPWTVYFAGGVPDYMPIISGGGAVVPHENQAYKVTLSSGTAIAVNSAGLTSDICVTQELWLDMPSAAVPFTLQSFTWVDGAAPDFTSASTRYAVTVRWDGTEFLANLAYTKDLA